MHLESFRISLQSRRKIFFIAVILSIIVKQILISGLPIWIRDSIGGDEWLMIELGEHLMNGEWLGAYNYLTLAKGMMFPLFLAICCKIGISYISGINILYTAACLLALYVVGKFIKLYTLRYIFFASILFAPVSYDDIFLVYRNILIVPFAIVLICGLIMQYYYIGKNEKCQFIWGLLTGVAWAIIWHTREDAIWTLPLIGVAVVMCVIKVFFLCREQKKKCIINLGLCAIPIIILFLCIESISMMNYYHYGVWTTNELNDSSFAEAYKTIIKIKPDEEIDYVLITRDMMEKAFDASPSLALMEDRIEIMYNNREALVTAGRNPNNGEVNENLMVWVLSGEPIGLGIYDDAQEAENYWSKVLTELETAIDSGKIETRKTMPSASLIPFPEREDRWEILFESIEKMFRQCFAYDKRRACVYKTDPSIPESCIRRYENLTGNYSVNHDSYNVIISGWVFNENDEIYVATLEDATTVIQAIPFIESNDIYEGFRKTYGNDIRTTKNARFYLNTTLDKVDDVRLVFRTEQGKIAGEICLKDGAVKFSADSIYHVEEYTNNIVSDVKYEVAQDRVDRLNFIGNFYKKFNWYIFWGVLCYWVLKTIFIFRDIKSSDENKIIKWIFLTSTLGCVILINISLAYIDAFMFTISGGYLSASTTLGALFTSFGLVVILEEAIKKGKYYLARRK